MHPVTFVRNIEVAGPCFSYRIRDVHLFYVYLLIYLKYVIGPPFNLMCRDISFRYMSMVCQLNIYRTINSGSPAGEDQQILRMLDSRYYIAGAAGYKFGVFDE